MTRNFAKTILFTGAGLTKNFGGLLANEMWSKIFNHQQIQVHPKLRELLFGDYDYESIFYKVLSGEFSSQEKAALAAVILEVYEIIDDIIRDWISATSTSYPVNIYGLNNFIDRFAGRNREVGFFFTLNQDLFIERRFNIVDTALVLPGIQRIPDSHKTILNLPIEKQDFISLPTADKIINIKLNSILNKTIYYIKLHGSFGWKSSDGTNRLVIGKDKIKQINEEPILSWYFELFKKALLVDGRKLFVIGYGFRDNHINRVLAESIERFGLKLYVLSPTPPANFKENLKRVTYGEQIKTALSGYFPYSLSEVFPADQSETHAWREIVNRFFSDY